MESHWAAQWGCTECTKILAAQFTSLQEEGNVRIVVGLKRLVKGRKEGWRFTRSWQPTRLNGCNDVCLYMTKSGERGVGPQSLGKDTSVDPGLCVHRHIFSEVSTRGDRGMVWPQRQGVAVEATAKSVNLQECDSADEYHICCIPLSNGSCMKNLGLALPAMVTVEGGDRPLLVNDPSCLSMRLGLLTAWASKCDDLWVSIGSQSPPASTWRCVRMGGWLPAGFPSSLGPLPAGACDGSRMPSWSEKARWHGHGNAVS